MLNGRFIITHGDIQLVYINTCRYSKMNRNFIGRLKKFEFKRLISKLKNIKMYKNTLYEETFYKLF